MTRAVRTDCRFYRGSRPCDPHKATGTICEGCAFYDRTGDRIAIVKLDAMGDVLRTAALLPDIAARHDRPHITWIAQPESLPMLRCVPLVDEAYSIDGIATLAATRTYTSVYALENSELGVGAAAALQAGSYHGFRPGASGKTEGVWPGGDPTIFEIGLWDDLKKQNSRSYLEMLAAAAGVSYSGGKPSLELPEDELAAAADEMRGLKRPVVAVNTDAGTRWKRKQWNLEYVSEAARTFAEMEWSVALFGGSRVAAFNDGLAAEMPGAVRSFQTAKDPRRLFALLSQADVLVTGDTLAMHAAWALGVPVVALFGPTSLSEIDLAPDDIKLSATSLPCLGCYRHTCSVSPHCMDLLTPPEIVRAVMRRLSVVPACAPPA